jgi:tetratricopeptide (TPR) repeat protein
MTWLKKLVDPGQPDPLDEVKRAEEVGDWRQAGLLYQQMGDLESALDCFERAQAYNLCGELSLQLARKERAAKFFLLDGDKLRAAELLEQLGQEARAAEIYLEMGSFPRAASVFLQAGEALRAGETYLQGSCHLEAGDAFEAAGEPRRAGEAYLKGHHYTKAAAAFEQLGEYAQAGKIYEKSGRHAKAGAAFERAGDFLQAARVYERQITEAGIEGRYLADDEAEALRRISIRAAECFEKSGKLEEAAKILERSGECALAAGFAERLGQYRRAGELYSEAGESGRAAEMYARSGDDRTAASLQGEHEISLGNQQAAAESFLESGEPMRAVELFERLGQFDRAADCYEAVEAFQEAADAAIRAGSKERAAGLLVKTKQFAMAAELYTQAGDFERSMNLYAESGRFFEAAKAAAEANSEDKMVEFLQRVPPQDSNYRTAVAQLAQRFIRRGWGSLGVEKLDSLLAGQPIRPEDMELWDLLAQAHESQGHLQIAAELLHKMMGVQHNYKDIQARHLRLLEDIKEKEQREQTFLAPSSTGSRARSASGSDYDVGQRYELQDLLGKGGMGAVYRAYDRLLKRPVAYKVLSERRAGNPEARDRLLEEARAAAALNHPNIITIHDIGIARDQAFICMELIEGESYASLLAKRKRFPIPDVMHLLVSVCQGLDHAHHRGIVHRDLKPSNLLLTVDNRVKIVDFGIAAPIHQEDGTGRQGSSGGTPKYIAPEQARGEPSDARSDIYSLGASVYGLLLGTPPFVEGDLIQHHLSTPVPPLSSRGLEVPSALEELVLHCMAKQPSERFQSAGEIISFASAARLL